LNTIVKEQRERESLESKIDTPKVDEEIIKLDLVKLKGLFDLEAMNDNQESVVKVDTSILVNYVRSNLGRSQEEYGMLSDSGIMSSYKQILDDDKKGVYRKAENDDVEKSSMFNDAKSEVLTREEAEEKIKNIQYAQIMGSPMDVDPMTRRKVANWIMFNPALFRLFESNYAMTRDVDYNRFI